MFQIKQGHRVVERTTTPEMADTVAKEASKSGNLITVTEVWDDEPENAVADYFDGHKL